MNTISLNPLQHKNEQHIAINFAYNTEIKNHVLKLEGVKWSKTHNTFYLPFSASNKTKLFQHFNSKGWFVDYSKIQEGKAAKAIPQKVEFSLPQKKILHQYVAYLRGKRYSESSVRTYYHFIFLFVSHIGDKPLEQLSNRDVELFVEQKIAAKNYAISSHRQCISALKHFFELFPETLIDSLKIHSPKKSRLLPTILSKEEVINLLRATRNLKHRAILALIYSSGFRIGELLSLKLHEIDILRRQVLIKNAKGRKDRVVVLAESILPLLNNYINTYQPKIYFAEGKEGETYSAESIRAFLKVSCKRAGINKRITPHSLRHAYATHMLENGIDLRYIQELLGHSRPETTMIYTHVSRKDMLQIKSPLDVTVKEFLGKGKSEENILLSRSWKG